VPYITKKGDSACHLSENAQSASLGGILKQKKITRTKSKKNNLQGAKQKYPILQGGKGLLTLI